MFPVQITIRDFATSTALETHIRQRAEKLTKFYDRINRCKVVIEMQQKHPNKGKLFNARIDLSVPGKELVVTHKINKDVYLAIRDAFDAMERRLEEHSHKRHGRVKSHNHVMHGHVSRILTQQGYGFIEGTDGNEYYFSLTNLANTDGDHIFIGDAVEYTPEPQGDGLQAIHIVKERHHHEAI